MEVQKARNFLLYLSILISASLIVVSSMDLFNVKFIEQSVDSRLIATSNYNYAITSPRLLAKNWKTVSVNGDSLIIVTTSGEKLLTTKSQLGPESMLFIEGLRDEISSSNSGFTHVSSSTGGSSSGGDFMMSSSTGGGTSFSSSTGGSSSIMSSNGGSLNGMSVNMKDEANFSVSRSDLPFSWSRVFFNGEYVTFIHRNGDVRMLPISLVEPLQLEAVNKLRQEVKEMQRTQAQQISNTMQSSLDMVSSVFNNIMGSFPKPPSYESAVGNMFGNNFPFGPNNSPFSSSSGWPFSNGAFAGAFAGR